MLGLARTNDPKQQGLKPTSAAHCSSASQLARTNDPKQQGLKRRVAVVAPARVGKPEPMIQNNKD